MHPFPKKPFTTILAQRAGETSRASACAILRVAGSIVEALALALAILAVEFVIARTIAQHADPSSGAVTASVLGRAGSSVLAVAFLRAVLSEGIFGAQLAAILPAVSGRADAGAVNGRALRVVLAIAVLLTALTEGVEGTRPVADLAVPSLLAGALPGPRMTQLRIVGLAIANLRTIRTVQVVLASPFAAFCASPAGSAYTRTINRIARSFIFTGAVPSAV